MFGLSSDTLGLVMSYVISAIMFSFGVAMAFNVRGSARAFARKAQEHSFVTSRTYHYWFVRGFGWLLVVAIPLLTAALTNALVRGN